MERMRSLLRLLALPSLRMALAVTLFIAVMTVIAAGGCTNSATNNPPLPSVSPVSPTPTVTPSGATPTPTPTPPPQIFVSMDTTVGATNDPTYGTISGYGELSVAPTSSPLSTPAPPQIIMVPENETIAFLNFDRTGPHTASLLGNANGMMWPATFTNNNGASGFTPAGSPITTSNFSTGTVPVSGGLPVYSFIYNTGSMPGMFYFGDFYDYLAATPFRTVIIVQ